MNSLSVSRRLLTPLALASVFVLFAVIGPSHAAAQTASVETNQILPPGQNTCPLISVTSVQPYVYGGVLESFDVTISDTSNGYVGILSSVGNTGIPLDQITRWAGSPSGLRIHVDTPDTPVGGGLPVSLTLLSSLPNQPTCITSIVFDVNGSGTAVAASAPVSVAPTTSGSGSALTQPVGTPVTTTSTGNAGSVASSKPPAGNSSSMSNGSSTAMAGASVAAASNSKLLSNVCTGNNVYRLWFILLAIYVVIVAVVVFAEPWFLEDSVIGSTASILVPLILLLGFWYFSPGCRAAAWIPVLACVVAIVGLFLAFREYETLPLLPASSNR